MSILREIAIKYIDSEKEYGNKRDEYHYNCAEILLNACNDHYELGADSKMLRAIVPFGGGMSCESTCGALTGGILALGLMFAEEKPSTNEKVKDISKQWVESFETRFANINCKELKETHRDAEYGCKFLILESIELLGSVIKQYK